MLSWAVIASSSSNPHDRPREALDSFLKRDDEYIWSCFGDVDATFI
jgi:hypothetical protein